jgi:hypothetical protein
VTDWTPNLAIAISGDPMPARWDRVQAIGAM